MEALAFSNFSSKLAVLDPSHHSHFSSLRKFPSIGVVLKTHRNLEALSPSSRLRSFRVLTFAVYGSGDGVDVNPLNGSALPELEHNTRELGEWSYQTGAEEEKITSSNRANGFGTGTRTGLFRTPISGGVHSATSTHDLPPPALAVRNLMEQARFAHLCTLMSRMHHHRAGYPFGCLVDFVADSAGHPIFSLSPLAIHTRNLLVDPRCSLVVQIPGWSGLSNARVTIFGDSVPLSADQQEYASQQFMTKHQQWASQQWGNFYYYRMDSIRSSYSSMASYSRTPFLHSCILDIYFIGGFGTVQWIDVKEYEVIQPDKIAADGGEQNLKELNAIFSKSLRQVLSTEGEIDDAALISIDSKGTDIRVRQGSQFNIQRLSFEMEHGGVETLEQAKNALQKIIDREGKSRANF